MCKRLLVLLIAGAIARPPLVYAAPTGPRDLPPVDRSLLPPADERWSSPDEQARHRGVMDQLWTTKLGQMYLAYLTDPGPAATIPGRANQIVKLVFNDGDKAGARVRALQLLTEDMYARERMSVEVSHRAIIFDRVVQSRMSAGEEATNRWIVNGMLTTFAVSLPFGFEGFREEADRMYRYTSKRLLCRGGCEEVGANPGRLLDLRSLGRYRFSRAFGTFLNYFGPISMFYFVWYQWKPGWMTKNKKDTEMLNGRDDLLERAEF